MYIILSQKIDTTTSYSDEVFKVYHYPARYKNQIHEGDRFIYYQGNRFIKNQRYYFGKGIVEFIYTNDGENYYARLAHCSKFEYTVPIYLPDGGYIEQLSYENVRKKPNPPWQSSIRPISLQAYKYISKHGGNLINQPEDNSEEDLKNELKNVIRSFYIDKNTQSIKNVRDIATRLTSRLLSDDSE